MSFLSYKVIRGTCLRFPEQLEVVVAGDVLQQRLPARPVAFTVFLENSRTHERLVKPSKRQRASFSDAYHTLFLLLLIETRVPLPPQLGHLLLVALLTI